MKQMEHLVLRFGKALTQEPGALETEPGHAPLWIALGYLDTLQIYPLPSGETHWLERAYQNNVRETMRSNGRFYLHPIHISRLPSEDEFETDFLNVPSPYLFVTLLQGKPFHQEPEALRAKVEEHLRQKLGDQSKAAAPLYFRIYHSITLSDLVVLWKCSSIRAILDAVQCLYCAPMVGDLHTIPTILADSIRERADAPRIEREELPLTIGRYVVRNAGLASAFFAKFPLPSGQPSFTAGIEDLTWVQEHWTTFELRLLLCSRLENKEYREQFQQAFLCCETHLGAPMQPTANEQRAESPLTQRCQQLMQDFQELVKMRDWGGDLDTPWLKTTGELLNALLDLSRNTVADGFCYLMLDAVSLFCSKLEDEECRVMSSQRLQGVMRFLRGWESLMDKVLRTDGRFSQQPGFSPALCDIPSSLLEFYLAFTTQAGQIMQMGSEPSRKFSLMLAPKLCRRIKVEKVFDEEPPCDRLLYVDVPIAMLYQPFQVLCHLTHEISHFSGDGWRLRQLRSQKYLAICARELGAELMMVQPETLSRIQQDLSTPELQRLEYLDTLERETVRHTGRLLRDATVVQKWMDLEFRRHAPDQWGGPLQCQLKLQEVKSAIHRCPKKPQALFYQVMEDFKYLFKECYADETAIFTLELSPKEYLWLNGRENQLFERSYEKGSSYYRNVERWTIILNICFPGQLQQIFAHPPSDLASFVEDIHQCFRFFYTDEQMTEQEANVITTNYHKIESIRLLTEYLRPCYAQMRSSVDKIQMKSLNRLRSAFRALAREELDLSVPACSDLVEQYRRKIL